MSYLRLQYFKSGVIWMQVTEILIKYIRQNWKKLLRGCRGFPGGLSGKESTRQAADMDLIPGSGGFPEEENGNPFQYSCLENPTDRGAWQSTVHRVKKSWTWLKWLSMHARTLWPYASKRSFFPFHHYHLGQSSSSLTWSTTQPTKNGLPVFTHAELLNFSTPQA